MANELLDVARSELAAQLRDPSSVGFDAETAAGVVEALFSGSMDAGTVVEGLLGGEPKAAKAVARFCAAVAEVRGGGSGSGSSTSGSAAAAGPSSSSSASTYQPASLSAEAAAARARDEASRSAAAAVATVSTGALSAVPAGARPGRALVFKEAKPQSERAESSSSGKQALGDRKVLPAERANANCLCCGRVYSFARSNNNADAADTRRLLETGRCVELGCGARVALRAGEVSDVRPANRPSSTFSTFSTSTSSSFETAAAAAFVEDLARNPWLSSSERAAAIASAREAEGVAAVAPVEEEEEDEGNEEEGKSIESAPGLSPRPLFSLPPPPRWSRKQRFDHSEGKGGSYGEEGHDEEKKQVIPGYYAPEEEEASRKGKGKMRGG